MRQKDEKRASKEARVLGIMGALRGWIAEHFTMAGVKKFVALSEKDRERELGKLIFEIDSTDKSQLE